MLQIILAVIGLSLVGALGLVTVQQFALQARIQDQTENMRRLDIAAQSLAGSLGRIPGVDSLLAPAPRVIDGGYSVLPAGVGSNNQTVAGVPFLYCPLAPVMTTDERNGLLANFAGDPPVTSIPMANGSYNAVLFQNLVIDDNFSFTPPTGFQAPNRAGERIVAFIVSAGTRGTAPRDCNSIYLVNGKPVVDGGIVRAVSAPNTTTGNSASSVEFWVSPNGSGPGTQASPANINTALEHFVRYSPSQMTINMIGTNTVSAATWARFNQPSTVSGATLRIVGISNNPTLNMSATGLWNIPATTVFQNVNIVGPTIIVGPGDTLVNSFNVSYVTSTGSGSSINIMPGGRMIGGRRPGEAAGHSINVTSTVAQSNFVGILNRGTLDIDSSSYVYGGTVAIGVLAGTGSVTDFTNFAMGSLTRSATTPILVENDIDLLTTDAASTVLASSSGFCMLATTTVNPVTRWSQLVALTGGGNQIGQRSAIVGEAAFPRPDETAAPEVLEAYQLDFNSRAIARRLNASNFLCQ